jgi:hypothetical protein
LRSDIVTVSPQEKHQADAAVVMISSFAFSASAARRGVEAEAQRLRFNRRKRPDFSASTNLRQLLSTESLFLKQQAKA